MAEPMPPKHRVSLTEVLTIDDLINLVSMKARTRVGRIVTGVSSVALLAAIIVAPIIIRSSQSGAGPSSTPTIPVITVPPNTDARTAFVPVTQQIDTASLHDNTRYGLSPDRSTATTTPQPPPTVAPPTTQAPPVTTPATFPQLAAPPVTSPPVTFPPETFPPATSPPATAPPVTSPPLTVPHGGVITPGH
jgi:hypothetical protein